MRCRARSRLAGLPSQHPQSCPLPNQPPARAQAGKGGIIANPNCSTIIALTAVTPLHRAATVQRMVVSTYQAASGAGAAAMAELEQQTREVLEGKPVTKNIFPLQARRWPPDFPRKPAEAGEPGALEERGRKRGL